MHWQQYVTITFGVLGLIVAGLQFFVTPRKFEGTAALVGNIFWQSILYSGGWYGQ